MKKWGMRSHLAVPAGIEREQNPLHETGRRNQSYQENRWEMWAQTKGAQSSYFRSCAGDREKKILGGCCLCTGTVGNVMKNWYWRAVTRNCLQRTIPGSRRTLRSDTKAEILVEGVDLSLSHRPHTWNPRTKTRKDEHKPYCDCHKWKFEVTDRVTRDGNPHFINGLQIFSCLLTASRAFVIRFHAAQATLS